MLRIGFKAALAVSLLLGSGAAVAKQPVAKPKLIDAETTLTRSDGSIVRFVPSASAKTFSQTLTDPPRAPDPCLFRYSSFYCEMADGKLATTDVGMGFVVTFDGVTPSYNAVWSNTAKNIRRSQYYELSDRCPQNWYLDYGGPLAGDEVCWSPGQLYVYWLYPHVAGDYVYDGYAIGATTVHATAKVVPGTLSVVAGNGQSTLVSTFAQAPLVAKLQNYRGETVSYPVDNSRPTVINPFTYTISGPTNAVGATTDPVNGIPGADGTASVRVSAGSKVGTYNITISSEDATPLVAGANLFAVDRKEPDDNKDKEEGDGEDCSVADPISIGIGNSFQQEIDYASTGLSLMEFSRSYNALGSKSKLMGNYWTTTFDRAVMPPAVAGSPYRVRRPDGRVIPFALQGTQYVSLRPYFHGTLKQSGTGWRYITEDLLTETYDSQGRWVTISDANGRMLTATYNTKGLLAKVAANTGEWLTFTYNAYNQMASATDHGSRVWTYTYNGYANLTQVKDPDGLYHTYHYDSPAGPYLLSGISIGRTQVPYASERYVTWEFDSSGRATANYYSGGIKRYDISYNDATGERVVQDALLNQTIYQTRTLNGKGFVEGAVGPGFATCGFADSEVQRDLNMNIVSSTSFGRVTAYGDYDAKGQYAYKIESANKPSARRTDYVYDPRFVGRPTSITSPSVASGRVRSAQFIYDPAGNILQEQTAGYRPDGTPVSRLVSYQYNGPLGQLSQIDGPRTDVQDITRFEYNATTKRLLRVIDANGIVIRDNIAYTGTGNMASEDRPNGLHVSYAYYPGTDLLKSVTESNGSDVRTTSWTYNDRRLVASLTFSDGVNPNLVTNFEYSVAGDLTKISSPSTGTIQYTLDKAGNRLREAYLDPANSEKRWIQRTFDAYGRLKDLINSGSQSTYSFHPEGTLTSATDGNARTTTYGYDDFKRLTEVVRPGAVTTTFGYDNQDRLTNITDPNLGVTQVLYDDLGNRVRIDSPDTGSTVSEFDSAGNRTRVIDAMGQETTYTYDPGNRLKTVTRQDPADDELYTYDTCLKGVGKICSSTLGIGEFINYEYDGLGRIAKQTTNAGAVAFKYDAGGNVVEITYPSLRKVRYERDSAGFVTGVDVIDGGNKYALARGILRLPYGPATKWTYGNGIVETRQYDKQYRPVSLGSSGSSVTYGSYDGNSNITQRTVNGDNQTFTYDAFDRLDTAQGGFGSRDYDYDSVGNRSALLKNGASTSYLYEPNSNRLSSDSNWAYARDANGNETERRAADGSGWSLTYSSHNRLIGVTDLQNSSTMVAGYRYNALGQRTVKATYQGDTRFVYGINGEMLAELLVDGSVVQEYVYLDGAPIALLGVPATPAAPFMVDETIDNLGSDPHCAKKNSSNAVNGSYLNCPYAYGDQSFGLLWPWTPPVTGDYDVYVKWAWSGPYQCYRFMPSWTSVCAGGTDTLAGAWLSLGRQHLVAGSENPVLETSSNSLTGTLRMDAVRYVLVHKDLTDRDYKYVHSDVLGTPLRVSDKAGVVVWTASYDPFGMATVNDDPDANGVHQTLNLRFAGQYHDVETGLAYNYYRDYDPNRGRYLTSDPLGVAGGLNTYSYVEENPLSRIDPFGLQEVPGFTSTDSGGMRLDLQYWLYRTLEALGFPISGPAAAAVQAKSFVDMRNDDTIGNDKYFHCVANCQSSRIAGGTAACAVAGAREDSQESLNWHNEDRAADEAANAFGRTGASSPASCQQVCANYIVNGINSKYLP
jgi:RHS repeat-associated protein